MEYIRPFLFPTREEVFICHSIYQGLQLVAVQATRVANNMLLGYICIYLHTGDNRECVWTGSKLTGKAYFIFGFLVIPGQSN